MIPKSNIEPEDLEYALDNLHAHGGLRTFRREFAVPLRWRWRESNPRPDEANQTFSGCSRLDVLLGPCAHAGMSQTGPARFESRATLRARVARQAF